MAQRSYIQYNARGGSRADAASKMECFVIIVYRKALHLGSWVHALTIIMFDLYE